MTNAGYAHKAFVEQIAELEAEVERLQDELKFAGDEANRRGDKLGRIQQILDERVGGDPE